MCIVDIIVLVWSHVASLSLSQLDILQSDRPSTVFKVPSGLYADTSQTPSPSISI